MEPLHPNLPLFFAVKKLEKSLICLDLLVNLSEHFLLQNDKVPWASILTSMPVLALNICNFARSWVFFLLLTNEPTYLNTFGFTIAEVRFLVSRFSMRYPLVPSLIITPLYQRICIYGRSPYIQILCLYYPLGHCDYYQQEVAPPSVTEWRLFRKERKGIALRNPLTTSLTSSTTFQLFLITIFIICFILCMHQIKTLSYFNLNCPVISCHCLCRTVFTRPYRTY